jgi:hypothetical protein
MLYILNAALSRRKIAPTLSCLALSIVPIAASGQNEAAEQYDHSIHNMWAMYRDIWLMLEALLMTGGVEWGTFVMSSGVLII